MFRKVILTVLAFLFALGFAEGIFLSFKAAQSADTLPEKWQAVKAKMTTRLMHVPGRHVRWRSITASSAG